MEDPDVALAITESGSVDLFETYEQLVLHSEGYSNTHNKVRTFLHKYRLDRILSPSEIQSLPYADGKYRPTDESYKALNHQKCIRLLRMIPVDATNSQVAENAIQALLPDKGKVGRCPWNFRSRPGPNGRSYRSCSSAMVIIGVIIGSSWSS